ncbi:unnamed protein product [Cuscuta epithymum]|uniref:Membrane-associated kinase regulator 2 n=1 Tax=Cuscuta epithymum TaxID=186058 RepID=A0AAV0EQ33_9ASTE|nr:unnamed protein product [Cuscuta epithymum]
MEAKAFSLLKYWRGRRGRSISLGDGEFAAASTVGSTTVDCSARQHFADSDSGSDAEDDGPFFDLRFTAVTEDDDDGENEDAYGDVQFSETDGRSGSGEPDSESEGELKLAFSPSSASNVDGGNISFSPPDGIVSATEVNSKFPVSLLKSATKLRVLMLKLNRPKQKDEKLGRNPRQKTQIRGERMFFRVKLKVEEVKIRSLFKRHSSSNSNAHESSSGSSEERKSSKEMIRKYLKLVRSSGNLSFSGGATTAGACHLPPQSTAEENLETEPTECSEKAAVLRNARSQKRVVPQTLVKSRSASSAAAAPVPSKRLDDSLKEQNDGIQGAILHCKRSLNA